MDKSPATGVTRDRDPNGKIGHRGLARAQALEEPSAARSARSKPEWKDRPPQRLTRAQARLEDVRRSARSAKPEWRKSPPRRLAGPKPEWKSRPPQEARADGRPAWKIGPRATHKGPSPTGRAVRRKKATAHGPNGKIGPRAGHKGPSLTGRAVRRKKRAVHDPNGKIRPPRDSQGPTAGLEEPSDAGSARATTRVAKTGPRDRLDKGRKPELEETRPPQEAAERTAAGVEESRRAARRARAQA